MIDKEQKAAEIFEILDNLTLSSGKDFRDVISSDVMSEVVYTLTDKLPLSNLDTVTDFNNTFQAERESSYVVENFKHRQLRFRLIAEELFELAFALGLPKAEVYEMTMTSYRKVYSQEPFETNTRRVIETFDALLDLLVVVYGAFNIFNMDNAVREGMMEVYLSNMSKVCKNLDVVKSTVEKYKQEGIEVVTEELSSGEFIVKNKETNKILKAIDYKKPNLINILTEHKIIK